MDCQPLLYLLALTLQPQFAVAFQLDHAHPAAKCDQKNVCELVDWGLEMERLPQRARGPSTLDLRCKKTRHYRAYFGLQRNTGARERRVSTQAGVRRSVDKALLTIQLYRVVSLFFHMLGLFYLWKKMKPKQPPLSNATACHNVNMIKFPCRCPNVLAS